MFPIMGVFGRVMFCPGIFRPGIAGDRLWKDPCPFVGAATRLTTGRAKVRCGGIAADLPAFAPSIVVRVGLTSTWCIAVARFNSLGDILTALRATGCELTSAVRDTAVNPLGACIFT